MSIQKLRDQRERDLKGGRHVGTLSLIIDAILELEARKGMAQHLESFEQGARAMERRLAETSSIPCVEAPRPVAPLPQGDGDCGEDATPDGAGEFLGLGAGRSFGG